jgi:hypothetical protein
MDEKNAKKIAENIASNILAIPVFIVLFVPFVVALSIYSGWAISTAWGMVAVPIFGARELPISAAIAVYMLVNMLKPTHPRQYKDIKEDFGKNMALSLAAPLLALAIIWCSMRFYAS